MRVSTRRTDNTLPSGLDNGTAQHEQTANVVRTGKRTSAPLSYHNNKALRGVALGRPPTPRLPARALHPFPFFSLSSCVRPISLSRSPPSLICHCSTQLSDRNATDLALNPVEFRDRKERKGSKVSNYSSCNSSPAFCFSITRSLAGSLCSIGGVLTEDPTTRDLHMLATPPARSLDSPSFPTPLHGNSRRSALGRPHGRRLA